MDRHRHSQAWQRLLLLRSPKPQTRLKRLLKKQTSLPTLLTKLEAFQMAHHHLHHPPSISNPQQVAGTDHMNSLGAVSMTPTTPTVEKPLPQREQRKIPPAIPIEPVPNPLAITGAKLKTSDIVSPTHMTDSKLDTQESSARDTDKESSNRNES